MSDDVVITKEMGISHEEFFRNIPRVPDTDDYLTNGDGIVIESEGKSLSISISEQSERRIALIVLPVTNVTLTFSGYDEVGVRDVMEKFDRAFQRGGG